MDDDALSERDVADDVLAAKRIAALGPVDQEIVDALDDDRVLAQPDKLLTAFMPRFEPRFFLFFGIELGKFFGAEEFGDNISRKRLP